MEWRPRVMTSSLPASAQPNHLRHYSPCIARRGTCTCYNARDGVSWLPFTPPIGRGCQMNSRLPRCVTVSGPQLRYILPKSAQARRYTSASTITTFASSPRTPYNIRPAARTYTSSQANGKMASAITGGKFDPNTDIPDLSDKVCHHSRLLDVCRKQLTDSPAGVQVYVVTGGSAGIGFGIVAHILQHNPAKIYLLSLKEEHAQQALDSLKQYGDPSKVEFVQTQLEDLHQVDQVAKKLKGQLDQLDGVCVS